jgi:hypothetical protein
MVTFVTLAILAQSRYLAKTSNTKQVWVTGIWELSKERWIPLALLGMGT